MRALARQIADTVLLDRETLSGSRAIRDDFFVVRPAQREELKPPESQDTNLNRLAKTLRDENALYSDPVFLRREVLSLGVEVLKDFARKFPGRDIYAGASQKSLIRDFHALLGETGPIEDEFLPRMFDSLDATLKNFPGADNGVLDRHLLKSVMSKCQVAAVHLAIRAGAEQLEQPENGGRNLAADLPTPVSMGVLEEAVFAAAALEKPAYPYRTASSIFSRAVQVFYLLDDRRVLGAETTS